MADLRVWHYVSDRDLNRSGHVRPVPWYSLIEAGEADSNIFSDATASRIVILAAGRDVVRDKTNRIGSRDESQIECLHRNWADNSDNYLHRAEDVRFLNYRYAGSYRTKIADSNSNFRRAENLEGNCYTGFVDADTEIVSSGLGLLSQRIEHINIVRIRITSDGIDLFYLREDDKVVTISNRNREVIIAAAVNLCIRDGAGEYVLWSIGQINAYNGTSHMIVHDQYN